MGRTRKDCEDRDKCGPQQLSKCLVIRGHQRVSCPPSDDVQARRAHAMPIMTAGWTTSWRFRGPPRQSLPRSGKERFANTVVSFIWCSLPFRTALPSANTTQHFTSSGSKPCALRMKWSSADFRAKSLLHCKHLVDCSPPSSAKATCDRSTREIRRCSSGNRTSTPTLQTCNPARSCRERSRVA